MPSSLLPSSEVVIKETHSSERFELKSGTLALSTRRRSRESEVSASSESLIVHEFLATATFMPDDKTLRVMLKMMVQQGQLFHGALTLPPIISASRIVPSDAPVFDYVRRDLLDDFVRHLRSGGGVCERPG